MTTGYFLRWWTSYHSFPGPTLSKMPAESISHPGDVQDVKFPTHVHFTKSNSRRLPAPLPSPQLTQARLIICQENNWKERGNDIGKAHANAMAEVRVNRPVPCGYDEQFVDPPDEDLQCIICYLPSKEPVLTRCGHKFCRQCLEEYVRRYW